MISKIKLLALALVGGASIATCIGFNQLNDHQIDDKAFAVSTLQPNIKIKVYAPRTGNYKTLTNPRIHLYNIKTYFDDEVNPQKTISTEVFETQTTKRVVFKDDKNWGNTRLLRAYGWNDNGDITTFDFPGTPLNHLNGNYYYIDINKTTENIIFNNVDWHNHDLGDKTPDISLANKTYIKSTYDSDGNLLINDQSCFTNSQYYEEAPGNVYSHGDTNGCLIINHIDNDGSVPKATNLKLKKDGSYYFPHFIKSFDIDIIGDIERNGVSYLVQLQKPFHVENRKDIGTQVDITFSQLKVPVQYDHDNHIEKIAGNMSAPSEASMSITSETQNYYRFIQDYTSLVKHSEYQGDSFSICNCLKDSKNKEALANLVNDYHDYDIITGLGKDNIAKLHWIIDKYDRQGNMISVFDTMNYISNYVNLNFTNNAPLSHFLIDEDKTTKIIVSASFILLVISSLILFIVKEIKIKRQ